MVIFLWFFNFCWLLFSKGACYLSSLNSVCLMIRFSMFSLRKVHLLFDEQNLNQNIYVFFNSNLIIVE